MQTSVRAATKIDVRAATKTNFHTATKPTFTRKRLPMFTPQSKPTVKPKRKPTSEHKNLRSHRNGGQRSHRDGNPHSQKNEGRRPHHAQADVHTDKKPTFAPPNKPNVHAEIKTKGLYKKKTNVRTAIKPTFAPKTHGGWISGTWLARILPRELRESIHLQAEMKCISIQNPIVLIER